MIRILWPASVNQAHRRLGPSLSPNHCCFRGSNIHGFFPCPSGPSTEDPCFPLLLVEVFAPWILPLSSSWVLLQFNQPSLILGQCRSQVKFSRAFVRSVHAWTACVVCDIVCRLRDWLESISAVAWFFKSVSLCTCPVSLSYKTNFQRHFLYTANSVVIVTVTSVNVSHCCSL